LAQRKRHQRAEREEDSLHSSVPSARVGISRRRVNPFPALMQNPVNEQKGPGPKWALAQILRLALSDEHDVNAGAQPYVVSQIPTGIVVVGIKNDIVTIHNHPLA
jgi:hypothetical protein